MATQPRRVQRFRPYALENADSSNSTRPSKGATSPIAAIIETQIQEYESKISELEATISKLKAECEETVQKLTNSESEIKEFYSAQTVLMDEIESLYRENNSLKESLDNGVVKKMREISGELLKRVGMRASDRNHRRLRTH